MSKNNLEEGEIWKYSKYSHDYPQMLIEHMKTGLSFLSFAGVVNVDGETLRKWCKRWPMFNKARKLGLSKGLLWWEKAGIDGLHDKTFNANHWKINMANRYKSEWSLGEQKISIEAKIRGDVKSIHKMSDQEVLKIGKEAVDYLEAQIE